MVIFRKQDFGVNSKMEKPCPVVIVGGFGYFKKGPERHGAFVNSVTVCIVAGRPVGSVSPMKLGLKIWKPVDLS